MKSKKIIILFIMACLFVGCDMQREPERKVQFDIHLCLPTEESAYYAPSRIPGDPGKGEIFALPKYAYIFIMKQVGVTWSAWRKEELILNAEKWERTNYNGILIGRGDDIYLYTERLKFLLADETPKGRVFVICSNKRLTLTPSVANVSNLDDVLTMTFNTAPDSIQENMQNIYSTPYNYKVNGKYYCTYDCSLGNSFDLDILLYHVAAKVDISWNVDSAVRINKVTPSAGVRLTKMKACNLFNGNAYCFKPMENSSDSPLDSGKEITIVQSTDEGLWWEGRSYFYTIPYTTTYKPGYYPLQMQMATNDSGDHNRTIYLQVDTSSPFVPWLRATFNLNEPLVPGTGDEITENF